MTEDDALMASLRDLAAQLDPVPADVVAAAGAALATRRLDEELAALVADSALTGAQVRATESDVRLLVFETGEISVELQVELRGDRMAVRGLVTGATGDAVIEVAGERHTAPVEDGWFAATGLPRGATRVRVSSTRGPVITGWVNL